MCKTLNIMHKYDMLKIYTITFNITGRGDFDPHPHLGSLASSNTLDLIGLKTNITCYNFFNVILYPVLLSYLHLVDIYMRHKHYKFPRLQNTDSVLSQLYSELNAIMTSMAYHIKRGSFSAR